MTKNSPRRYGRLLLAALVGAVAWPVWKAIKAPRGWTPAARAPRARLRAADADDARTVPGRPRRSTSASFVLAGVGLTLLLFGGAALAAGASELAAEAPATETAGTESTETSATDPGSTSTVAESPESPSPPPPPPPPDDSSGGGGSPDPSAPAPQPKPPPAPVTPPAWLDKPETAQLDPEVRDPHSAATIWLYRILPDPTPAAKRLAPEFAREVAAVARRERVHWSILLGALRAGGREGRVLATAPELRVLARRLTAAGVRRQPWAALVAYSGRPSFADQATALAHYNRAVGLRALVRGLAASKESFQERILRSPRLEIYPLGRADVASGRIDVRVLVVMLYLRRAYGEVTVSSLQTGHRLFARPGVVSAHMYGLAIDITALGNTPVAGNQRPGGLTERAVRDILLLPAEVQPRQVISLLGLGGPSFPLADHADHIHVGY